MSDFPSGREVHPTTIEQDSSMTAPLQSSTLNSDAIPSTGQALAQESTIDDGSQSRPKKRRNRKSHRSKREALETKAHALVTVTSEKTPVSVAQNLDTVLQPDAKLSQEAAAKPGRASKHVKHQRQASAQVTIEAERPSTQPIFANAQLNYFAPSSRQSFGMQLDPHGLSSICDAMFGHLSKPQGQAFPLSSHYDAREFLAKTAFQQQQAAESQLRRSRQLQAAEVTAKESLQNRVKAMQLRTASISANEIEPSPNESIPSMIDISLDLCLQASPEATGVSARIQVSLPVEMKFRCMLQFVGELTKHSTQDFVLRPVNHETGVPLCLRVPDDYEDCSIRSVQELLKMRNSDAWVQVLPRNVSRESREPWFAPFSTTQLSDKIMKSLIPYLAGGMTGFAYRVVNHFLSKLEPNLHCSWVQSCVESIPIKDTEPMAAMLQCLCVDGYLKVEQALTGLSRVLLVGTRSLKTHENRCKLMSAFDLGEGSMLKVTEETLSVYAPRQSPASCSSSNRAVVLTEEKKRERKLQAMLERTKEYEEISASASSKGSKNIFELSSALKTRIGSESVEGPQAGEPSPLGILSAAAISPTSQLPRSVIRELLSSENRPCTLSNETLRLLQVILSNLIKHHSPGASISSSTCSSLPPPLKKDCRKLKMSAAKLQEHVVKVPDALKILEAVGFVWTEVPKSPADSPRGSENNAQETSLDSESKTCVAPASSTEHTCDSCLVFPENGSFERAELALEKVKNLLC